jgi:predicted kinase
LVLLVGVSGSGKTTLSKKLVALGYHYMNADTIRERLYGKAIEQGNPKEVFAIFFQELEEALSQNEDIVVDNTNIKFMHRKQILDRARKSGYSDIQLWLMDTPLNTCLDRNAKRERVVPEDVIANQHLELNRGGRPQQSEGKLVIIRPGKDENDFRILNQQE